MYGKVVIGYRGRNPALFGFTALGAGLGAVIGYSRGGLPQALLGASLGGFLGLMAGYLFEAFMEELLKTYSVTKKSETTLSYYNRRDYALHYNTARR